MTAPTPEEIARHIAGARDFMKHQPKEAAGSCAAVLLHLAAQLEEAKDAGDTRLSQAIEDLQFALSDSEARADRAEAALGTARAEAFRTVAKWALAYVAEYADKANPHEITGIMLVAEHCVDLAAAEEEKP